MIFSRRPFPYMMSQSRTGHKINRLLLYHKIAQNIRQVLSMRKGGETSKVIATLTVYVNLAGGDTMSGKKKNDLCSYFIKYALLTTILQLCSWGKKGSAPEVRANTESPRSKSLEAPFFFWEKVFYRPIFRAFDVDLFLSAKWKERWSSTFCSSLLQQTHTLPALIVCRLYHQSKPANGWHASKCTTTRNTNTQTTPNPLVHTQPVKSSFFYFFLRGYHRRVHFSVRARL